jgi:hypothetical protein
MSGVVSKENRRGCGSCDVGARDVEHGKGLVILVDFGVVEVRKRYTLL